VNNPIHNSPSVHGVEKSLKIPKG